MLDTPPLLRLTLVQTRFTEHFVVVSPEGHSVRVRKIVYVHIEDGRPRSERPARYETDADLEVTRLAADVFDIGGVEYRRKRIPLDVPKHCER